MLTPWVAHAAETGIIEGQVQTADGENIADARVTLSETRHQSMVDEKGGFRFDTVRPGSHLLVVHSPRFGRAVKRVEVRAGETASLVLELGLRGFNDEIVVTGSHDARRRDEMAQATEVLSQEELDLRRLSTLGETLSAATGVSSTYFGPGASRPIIRGLGGDRVRILQNGISTGDISNISVDHTVSLDTSTAEQVEIVRGPATLLYGSSAIGGVVNVIDGRIPLSQSAVPLRGSVTAFGNSVAEEASVALGLDGGRGAWAWHVDARRRETADYDIPGFAERPGLDEHEGEEEPVFGTIPNSDIETTAGAVGVSYFFGDRGFLGVSVSSFESNYGIAGHEEEGEEGEEEGEHGHGEEGVRIDVDHQHFDLRGRVNGGLGKLEAIKFRLGINDYSHIEGENLLDNEGYETRIEFLQSQRGRLAGSFGLQVESTEFSNIGDEAFIPPTETRSLGLFALEELRLSDRFRLEFGGRFENVDVEPVAGGGGRSFDGVSVSVGFVIELAERWSAGLSVARAVKVPTSKELFAFGAHPSTQTFEIGDPDLGEETSLGVDLSLRKTDGRVTGEVNLFANRFDDYIFQDFTGEVADGLPVVVYRHGDAEFRGIEAEVDIALVATEHRRLALRLFGDSTRAELRASGSALPRIPPRRYGAALRFRSSRLQGLLELRRVDRQDRVGVNETATAGYTLINASIGYRFFGDRQIYDVLLRGTNLGDEEARNHVSFNKDRVPLPGRDVALLLRLSF